MFILCFFCRVLAGVKRFTLGLIYLAMYTVLQPKVKDSFLITNEYDVSFSTQNDNNFFSHNQGEIFMFDPTENQLIC